MVEAVKMMADACALMHMSISDVFARAVYGGPDAEIDERMEATLRRSVDLILKMGRALRKFRGVAP